MKSEVVDTPTPVQFLKGVGPKLGDLLKRRGIGTIEDLLNFYPRTYEDRRAARSIRSLVADQVVSVKVQILKIRSMPLGKGSRKIWEVIIGDSSGQIACKYFRVPYKGYFERFEPHQQIRVIGKVTSYRGKLEFHHPDLHAVNEETDEEVNKLIPIYTELDGVSSSKFEKLIQSALNRPIVEKMPFWIREKYGLLTLDQALKQIHQPPLYQAELFLKIESPAQRRIIFDEFFAVEMHLAQRKSGIEREATCPIAAAGLKVKALEKALPFELTGAQLRSYDEIKTDLLKPHPMHRLVQGDVGSGKTLVALMSAVLAAEAGFQTAFMVPTEILGEQHFKTALVRLADLGIRVELLTGSTKGKERTAILENLKNGETNIIIGTHALIQEDVLFHKLGLVIIDEQHRFGVQQRNLLREKGHAPHFLIMTATPIPRTLAMTVYGDLDISIIDELPKGRMPITTRKTFETKRDLVNGFVREQIEKGRQAYIVVPLVEESEALDYKNAIEEFEKVKIEFPAFTIGLLHGRMKGAQKDDVMRDFRDGKIHILVATTVIEVGVDVPNANIMVIEHAERFGLSQLHQLRGRVGRGAFKSYCILMLGYALSEVARKRAEIMEQTNDGFKIAEADLEIRGPGEFLGTRQSGLPGFKLANLVRDVKILTQARQAAFELIAKDPRLILSENALLKVWREANEKLWIG
jgi:ATP-dependent DNA helicase RecG